MSAPVVVNTTDGTCWTRRDAIRDGLALYAPEKCGGCPEFVMATYAELEAHGIVGSADVLPVPVGPEPQALSGERERKIRRDYADFDSNGTVGVLLAEIDRLRARVAELEAQRERRRVRLVALSNDALNMRGALSPMGEDRKVPFPLGETLLPAVEWLIGRVAELEALTPARVQTCRVCGAGYTYGEPCSSCEFRKRMAAELQARGLDGEHEAAVHHDYRVSHDLPETGGAGRG